MVRQVIVSAAIFVVGISAFAAFSSAKPSEAQKPLEVIEKNIEPVIAYPVDNPVARAWGVFDPVTGELLAEKNANDAYPIASITKLFAAYALLESGKESEHTTLIWEDLNTEGESGKLVHGTKTKLGDLLFPLLIESSNDAGSAIARTLGTSYDAYMHALIEDIKLTHTHIEGTTGLSAYAVSSVRDLAHFYVYLKEAYPHIIDITKLYTYITSEDTGLINNNPARTLDTFMGGKHGYTAEAGKTFVGTFTVQNGIEAKEIGIVLLGSKDIVRDIKAILGVE